MNLKLKIKEYDKIVRLSSTDITYLIEAGIVYQWRLQGGLWWSLFELKQMSSMQDTPGYCQAWSGLKMAQSDTLLNILYFRNIVTHFRIIIGLKFFY